MGFFFVNQKSFSLNMNKIFRIIFSPSLAVFLLFAFAFAMAAATFIENDYGTQTARTVVYNTWWFEMIMLLLEKRSSQFYYFTSPL
jgi:hypothetical protein